MGHSWNEVLKAEHNRELEIRFHFSLGVTICVLFLDIKEKEVKSVVNGYGHICFPRVVLLLEICTVML